ncbi:DNA sulfur modification protein DndE [Pseudonocardia sp. KRD-184]|uniref:DNA sulfur modification protein DndE n=1 Tax=Pseudonocardia oceani TaxID=2792013 RepID=A0ABS6UJX2_9PSEU|nr:DNA sulfur modification protein DndE [Pseudonocardia oceani]MBW0090530.1 DNA sulfur modification protein DndE [Pseudonocardia oceani]MBW0095347.1 DNA sulfur modification protein DndE [Pseudonocardia oceani]MBW0108117.1 DNA sulfur modification protein DndE [Pseudonocardia oceani]MBW0120069.1 DNA sulfur modification protein DndE [Pseudonocardia oceani]MBW0132525.1 DNA sulfur modification protein DndE [Pseudonocardia oceani]
MSTRPATPPETLRLPEQTKEQLTTLKRRTGVKHWNTLCRWGLCRSLAAGGTPAEPPPGDGVEIAWKVFAGPAGDLWWALLLAGLVRDGQPADPEAAHTALRAHVVRGVSYLVGDPEVADVTSLARLALAATSHTPTG